MNKGSIHFILGGSRSGKSTWAEKVAQKSSRPVAYLATCRTSNLDVEMKDRISRHREQRPSEWITIEDQFDLIQIAKDYSSYTLVIDCLTLWLANEMTQSTTEQVLKLLEQSIDALIENRVHALIVSNEVGMGIVPIGKETREYRDLVGWANQLVAGKAEHVQWTVAGIRINLKKDGVLCDLDTEVN